jgi:hypothetical protein
MKNSKTRYIVVPGDVYCGRHGEIHEDTLDPYDFGEREDDNLCTPEDHQPVYIRVGDDVEVVDMLGTQR